MRDDLQNMDDILKKFWYSLLHIDSQERASPQAKTSTEIDFWGTELAVRMPEPKATAAKASAVPNKIETTANK